MMKLLEQCVPLLTRQLSEHFKDQIRWQRIHNGRIPRRNWFCKGGQKHRTCGVPALQSCNASTKSDSLAQLTQRSRTFYFWYDGCYRALNALCPCQAMSACVPTTLQNTTTGGTINSLKAWFQFLNLNRIPKLSSVQRNCAEPHDNVAPSRRELLSCTAAGIAASQLTLTQNVAASSALQDIEPLETTELGRTGTAI